MTLFSYVVDHDLGFAPNPYSGYCTLVHCKFSDTGERRNIVELAEIGDWILGTGGSGKQSAGHGKLIFLMRVDEKPTFEEFLADRRFRGRSDWIDFGSGNSFALVSERYFYFGKNALNISSLPEYLTTGLAKRGPGFRSDYPEEGIMGLIEWISRKYKTGMHGDPCGTTGASIKTRYRAGCSF
jgi:Nucleotide modification associated domain 2